VAPAYANRGVQRRRLDRKNGQPLNHLHGAPLRLRAENQLGFKMVKWIQAIEFVEDVQSINQGEGGYAEDHEYFGELANI
jgi:DMSO/TMAO reductase YedYZ molybdopterin-dependent catalytic subunit